LFLAEGRTDRETDRQTDMTKITVAFHNFANAPKKLTVVKLPFDKLTNCRLTNF
jgi:hypothetical protein